MSARDDYPLLRARETVVRYGMEQTAVESSRALDEIDRLRETLRRVVMDAPDDYCDHPTTCVCSFAVAWRTVEAMT